MRVQDRNKAITAERMREIEEKGHMMGFLRIYMMENAGAAMSNYIAGRFKVLRKRVVAVAGTGNNGGDALVVSRHLAGLGAKVTVILLGGPRDLKTEEARVNWYILEGMKSVELILAPESGKEIMQIIKRSDIIIDGIFGIGIKGKIKEPHSSVIDAINSSKAFKIAVDVPSGLDPDTGEIHDKCVKADATITFHRMKTGLPGRKVCGKIIVQHIGIPPEAEE
jgi:NAD(P)H-hydrate epimerase